MTLRPQRFWLPQASQILTAPSRIQSKPAPTTIEAGNGFNGSVSIYLLFFDPLLAPFGEGIVSLHCSSIVYHTN